MATVRITEALTGSIVSKADQDFRLRTQKRLDEIKKGLDHQIVADVVFGQWMDHHKLTHEVIAALPDAWKMRVQMFYVTKVNDVRWIGSEVKPPMPFTAPKYFLSDPMRNQVTSYAPEHSDLEANAQVCRDYHQVAKEMEAERQAFIQTVRGLMAKCTTLKQALEAWPQLIDLLPAETLAKHNEPEKRYNPNARPALDADTLSTLNVSLVKNKLGTAL